MSLLRWCQPCGLLESLCSKCMMFLVFCWSCYPLLNFSESLTAPALSLQGSFILPQAAVMVFSPLGFAVLPAIRPPLSLSADDTVPALPPAAPGLLWVRDQVTTLLRGCLLNSFEWDPQGTLCYFRELQCVQIATCFECSEATLPAFYFVVLFIYFFLFFVF